jgi:hypothetical protein
VFGAAAVRRTGFTGAANTRSPGLSMSIPEMYFLPSNLILISTCKNERRRKVMGRFFVKFSVSERDLEKQI